MTLGKLQQAWPATPTDNQSKHLAVIREACEMLRSVMHDADGSAQAGDHEEHVFSGQRMRTAAQYLEIAEMLATRAVLE